jgi:hypothetical protein
MKWNEFAWTKDFLVEQYINQDKSAKQIATELGFRSQTTVFKALKKFGIKRRTGYPTRDKDKERLRKTFWRGYQEVPKTFLCMIKANAKERDIGLSITIEDIWDLYIKQDRKCALSGIPISFAKTQTAEGKKLQTASLDRIDSNKDYTIDNIQLVHKSINRIKMAVPQDEFIMLCKAVAKHHQ